MKNVLFFDFFFEFFISRKLPPIVDVILMEDDWHAPLDNQLENDSSFLSWVLCVYTFGW
jgi:hypothetical protein